MVAALARAQAPSTTSIPAKGGDITITALGHASVQLEQGGKVILVDPVGAQTDLSKAKPADLILVSDIHPDHLDPGVIGRLRKPGAPVVVPPAVAALKNIPDPVVVMTNREMKSNDTAPAGIKVISVPAYNIERGPAPGQLYHPRERGQGYLLFISDKLVYVAADTECVPGDGHHAASAAGRCGHHADEPPVHDDPGGSRGVRERVYTEDRHPVSLRGTEA